MTNPDLQLDEQKPTVLVIDDSPDVHRLIKARMKQEEVEICGYTDPRLGLEHARSTPPAVILLDLDLSTVPNMDGFEVLRALKDHPATHHVPVIIVSGLTSLQDKITAFELGAIDYVVKPFEFTEFRIRVRSALRVNRLLTMLSTRAQLDGLTGLWNRAHFDSRLSEELARSARAASPLSIAMADCDFFKSINDTFGHPAGDSVLQGLAKILKHECRQSDAVCRYGGEEFVILMPDTKPADAAAVCERIRAAIQNTTWPRHPERKVTTSFGVVGLNATGAIDAGTLVEAVDKALYTSKKTGRNKVTVTELGTPVTSSAVAA